ncbi:MAG: family 1 glycosylhydrolase [Candidatus Pacebacteria bacterium]|nr:family 1 glycosylhydrolase [Candidatus Paceibacterota bacterium]
MQADTQPKQFPEGFYWGAATASYQVEGGIENNDWAKAAREGRVPVAGRSSDHYNRYEQDFDIAQELGHNAHRFSIEWARIEPEEGKFNEREIAHYRAVLQALHARGIKPYITLWHFTLPLWFSESGGFERNDSPEIFARYCAYVVEQLGDLCDSFSTMNEPSVLASNGWLRGTWPPFKRFALTDFISITNSGKSFEPKPEKGIGAVRVFFKVRKNLARAHNAAYVAIKQVKSDTDVSVVKHVILFEANWNPINKALAWFANWQWTHVFMKRVYKQCDSIGLNYYFYKKYGDTHVYEKTDMDWDIYPQGVYGGLNMLHRYGKPLFVSEAGIADARDVHRAAYIQTQVQAIWQAIEDGMDVRGHLYWSLLDNYEWALGYEKRFGLVEIDYETLERKVRPSAYVYKEICINNAL